MDDNNQIDDLFSRFDNFDTISEQVILKADQNLKEIYSDETYFERSMPKEFDTFFYPNVKAAEAGYGIPKKSPAGQRIAVAAIQKQNAKQIKTQIQDIRSKISQNPQINLEELNKLYDWFINAKAVSLQANLMLDKKTGLEDDFDFGTALKPPSLQANIFSDNDKKTRTKNIKLDIY